MIKKVLFYLFISIQSSNLFAQTFTWQTSITNGSRSNKSSVMYSPENFIILGGNPFNDSIIHVSSTTYAAINWDIILDIPSEPMIWDAFTISGKTYAVGDAGLLMQSSNNGLNWTYQNSPGNVHQRSLKSVFFVNQTTGFAAGGNLTNDSIYTILKTTNGGLNWSIVLDNLGEMLNDIFFVDNNLGFAVGNKGSLYKTVDSGTSWTKIAISGGAGTRNFNAVHFVDNNIGVIVGGNRSNDSIQTILKTIDGGTNWSIIRDNVASMLNDVDFYDNLNGFAVGRDGTILSTSDAGSTWSNIAISGVNNFWMFNHVNLINSSNAVLCADQGGVVFSSDPNNLLNFTTPPNIVINTLNSSKIAANALQINGEINLDNQPFNVFFEYGTNPLNLNFKATPFIDSYADNLNHSITDTLYNLSQNTVYYYRIAIENGLDTLYGNINSAYYGLPSIPNFNFELWDTTVAQKLNEWFSMGNISQVNSSIEGNYAVRIAADENSNADDFGVILQGNVGDMGFEGGVPFSERPDSIVIFTDYNIEFGDSALLLLITKKNGIILSQDYNYITGNSNGTFERLSFPLNYNSIDTPDSLIIGITSSNPFSPPTSALSYLILDNLHFVGATTNIPNASFESWFLESNIFPKFWQYVENENFTFNFSQTTDAQLDNFAITLENKILNSDTMYGILSTELNDNVWEYYNQPSFAVNHKPSKLFGYYKFNPSNNDTMQIVANFFENGINIGSAYFYAHQDITTYSLLEADVFYFSSTVQPDSASLGIQTFKNRPKGNSKAWIDNLNFDIIIVSNDSLFQDTTSIVSFIPNVLDITYFPNPTSNQISIQFFNENTIDCAIKLYSLDGKLVKTLFNGIILSGTFHESFSLDKLSNGNYILSISTNEGYQSNILQIKN